MNTRIALVILAALLGASLVLGQGGTGRDPAKKPSAPKPSTPSRSTPRSSRGPFRPTNPGIELVKIQPGRFVMGSDFWHRQNVVSSDWPTHEVTINYSFYLGKYEVTQAQWKAVMGYFNSSGVWGSEGSRLPAAPVSWDQAQSFIAQLNQLDNRFRYRLPTEAEWEYACRAGTTGDYAGDLNEMGWWHENSGDRMHPVGTKRPNAWGLYDMHGNAAEWCEDWQHDNYNGAPTDGTAWLTRGSRDQRVIRGGTYQDISSVMSWARFSHDPAGTPLGYGFRVAAVPR